MVARGAAKCGPFCMPILYSMFSNLSSFVFVFCVLVGGSRPVAIVASLCILRCTISQKAMNKLLFSYSLASE